jgi:multiple sugar transport system ATP-binding protein
LQAIVEIVEPMGAEAYVHLRAREERYVSRVHARDLPAPGEAVTPALDADRLHFFDAESGVALPVI